MILKIDSKQVFINKVIIILMTLFGQTESEHSYDSKEIKANIQLTGAFEIIPTYIIHLVRITT